MIQVSRIPIKGRSTLRAFPRGILSTYPVKSLELFRRLEPLATFKSLRSNLITSVGKGMVADLLLDLETIGVTYHAIGTDNTTPVVGDTTLGAESARKLWTAKERTANVITFSVFYLASESTYSIEECGAFGGASASGTADSGILFSHYLQSYDNSGGLVDITFEYELTIG